MNSLVLLAVAVCTASVSAVALVFALDARRQLRSLREQVGVFSEASVRVADTLDAMLLGEVSQAGDSLGRTHRTNQSSRRYLVNQARERILGGEQVETVTQRFGLSRDEVALLQRVKRAA